MYLGGTALRSRERAACLGKNVVVAAPSRRARMRRLRGLLHRSSVWAALGYSGTSRRTASYEGFQSRYDMCRLSFDGTGFRGEN